MSIIHIAPDIGYLFPDTADTALTICGKLVREVIEDGDFVGVKGNLNSGCIVCEKCSSITPEPTLFYIRNTKPIAVGNCALWWCVDGAGYTCDLRKAWRVPEEKAKSICRDRPEQDVAYPCALVDGLAVLHCDVQGLR